MGSKRFPLTKSRVSFTLTPALPRIIIRGEAQSLSMNPQHWRRKHWCCLKKRLRTSRCPSLENGWIRWQEKDREVFVWKHFFSVTADTPARKQLNDLSKTPKTEEASRRNYPRQDEQEERKPSWKKPCENSICLILTNLISMLKKSRWNSAFPRLFSWTRRLQLYYKNKNAKYKKSREIQGFEKG